MTVSNPNKSHDTDGTEDPSKQWMQRIVVVKEHPEWGEARVMRWYPAAQGQVARLRILAPSMRSPKVVPVSAVRVVA